MTNSFRGWKFWSAKCRGCAVSFASLLGGVRASSIASRCRAPSATSPWLAQVRLTNCSGRSTSWPLRGRRRRRFVFTLTRQAGTKQVHVTRANARHPTRPGGELVGVCKSVRRSSVNSVSARVSPGRRSQGVGGVHPMIVLVTLRRSATCAYASCHSFQKKCRTWGQQGGGFRLVKDGVARVFKQYAATCRSGKQTV